MHKAVKWLIRIAATGILFLLLSGGYASAAVPVITASCPSVCGEKISAREGSGGMILSLPGFWDLSKTSLEIGTHETVFLGPERTEVPCGQETDLSGFAGLRLLVRNQKGHEVCYLTVLQGSEIPALFLEADAKQLSRVNQNRNSQITEGRAAYYEADGTVTFDGALEQLKCRGNNSFRYAKKPYQIKLGEKTSLSGLGRGKTWVLLANWTDVSLLRNQIVLDMSRAAGLRYAVGCVQTDVWINGIYHGLYLMTEKIQIGKGRIDITNLEKETEKVNPEPFDPGTLTAEKTAEHPLLRSYPQVADPEDITGGYIFTVEKFARMRDYKLAGFRTKNDLSIQIKEPTYPSRKQAEYLFGLLSETQQALMASDGKNPVTGRHYEEYLDPESFAKKLLVEDWCKNYDLAGGSQFMYKDSDAADPLIYAGPAWDYDLSFGNMPDRGRSAEGTYATSYRRNGNLYWLLYRHKTFRKLAGDIWQQDFRPNVEVLLGERAAEPDGIVRSLDEYRNRISASAEMNYRRWGVGSENDKAAGTDFDGAVSYLKQWIAARSAWMNETYRTESVTDDE